MKIVSENQFSREDLFLYNCLQSAGSRLSGECTHLIVGTSRLKKTEKVLEAMARGDVKIVSVRWARACVKKGSLVPEDPYLIGPSPEYPGLPPMEQGGDSIELENYRKGFFALRPQP